MKVRDSTFVKLSKSNGRTVRVSAHMLPVPQRGSSGKPKIPLKTLGTKP